MEILLKIILIISIISSPSLTYAGDTITITSDGTADIGSAEKAGARDMAIEDALRKAVERGVGTFVGSETMVKNAKLIEDSIIYPFQRLREGIYGFKRNQ